MVRQWKRRFEAGATAAVATNEDVVPVSALREAHQQIRELERLLSWLYTGVVIGTSTNSYRLNRTVASEATGRYVGMTPTPTAPDFQLAPTGHARPYVIQVRDFIAR